MVVWHRSARQRLVTDGEVMKSPKSHPKSYKRIIELPQPGSAAKWTPEGGAGWYVVQEREQDDSADLVLTPLAGPRTIEREARVVNPHYASVSRGQDVFSQQVVNRVLGVTHRSNVTPHAQETLRR